MSEEWGEGNKFAQRGELEWRGGYLFSVKVGSAEGR